MKKLLIAILLLSQASLSFGQVYEVSALSFNSNGIEFAPVWHDGKLIFSKSSLIDNDARDSVTQVDLYYVESLDASPESVVRYDENLSSEFHDGSAIFLGDSMMIFTRSSYLKRRTLGFGEKGRMIHLALMRAIKYGEAWSEPGELSVSGDSYSTGYPTVSGDGNVLVYCSNQPGGYGGTDLYMAVWNGYDWTNPVNLGPEINTAGNEISPFLADGDRLYFASNGRSESQNMDVFCVSLRKEGRPSRLPAPINTPYDDFSFVLDSTSLQGFLASNRPGGRGFDDLYSFKQLFFDFKLKVKNESPGPAQVLVRTPAGKELARGETDKDGVFKAPISYNGPLAIAVSKEGYQQAETKLPPLNEYHTEVELIRNEPESPYYVRAGSDRYPVNVSNPESFIVKNGELTMCNVYYSFGSSTLHPAAKRKLDRLVELLRENSELVVQIASHTDGVGNRSYNQKLSEKRTDSVVSYLIKTGISSDRIVSGAFGEDKPINECDGKSDCTEEELELNRRTEFKLSVANG